MVLLFKLQGQRDGGRRYSHRCRSSAYDGQGSGRRIGEGNQRRRQRGRWQAVGDAKLESDGKTDKIEGKVQNAIGGLKGALKGK